MKTLIQKPPNDFFFLLCSISTTENTKSYSERRNNKSEQKKEKQWRQGERVRGWQGEGSGSERSKRRARFTNLLVWYNNVSCYCILAQEIDSLEVVFTDDLLRLSTWLQRREPGYMVVRWSPSDLHINTEKFLALVVAVVGWGEQTRVKWLRWVGLPSKPWFSLWRRVKLSLGTHQAHRHWTLIIHQSGALCWRGVFKLPWIFDQLLWFCLDREK